MRAMAAAVTVIVLCGGPALAQRQDPYQMKLEADKQAHKDAEKDYDATMRRIRSNTPAPKTDPWKVVRPTEGERKR